MWAFDECTAWSLGRFKPDLTVTPVAVRRQLKLFLAERVTSLGVVHLRHPDHEWSIYTMQGLWGPGMDNQFRWHRDTIDTGMGGKWGVQVNPEYLLTWSNQFPTQYRSVFHRRVVYEARPWELTVLDNNWVEHRAPKIPKYKAEGRWFARATFPRAAQIRDVAGVHQLTL